MAYKQRVSRLNDLRGHGRINLLIVTAGDAIQPAYTNGAQDVDLVCIIEDTTLQRLRHCAACHAMIKYRLLHDRYSFLRKSRAEEQGCRHFSSYLRVIPAGAAFSCLPDIM